MEEIKNTEEPAELTEEELAILAKEKKENKKIYQREYMRKRRESDPVFNEKQKEYNRIRKNFLYNNDAETKEKSQTYNRENYKNRINYKKKYEELLKTMENKI
jgi:hypothetical protein